MADGTRLRYDGVETYLATQLNQGVSTIEFTTALTADGGAPIDTLVGDEYLVLTILDANYRLAEIVHLTAYDSGALTGTIERAQEGTSDITHPADNKVVHAATVLDYTLVQDHDGDVSAHPEILIEAKAYTDTEIAAHEDDEENSHPNLVRRTGDSLEGDFTLSAVDANGDNNVFTVEGTLEIAGGAELVVNGDLVINGRLFLNGREIRADNNPPPAPTPNVIWFQTYG